jgi:hypothetical protein
MVFWRDMGLGARMDEVLVGDFWRRGSVKVQNLVFLGAIT